MTQPTDSAPQNAARQDFLRRLAGSLRGAKAGAGGDRLDLLDLTPARDHFGGDWPRLSAKVQSIVEGTLRKLLSEADTFIAVDELSYAVLSSRSGDRDVGDLLERVGDEIARRIMGDNSRKVLVTITHADAAADARPIAAKDAPKSVGRGVGGGWDNNSNIERIIGDLAAGEDEFSFAAVRFVMRPMVGADRRPLNTIVPVATMLDPLRRARFGYDCLPPEPDTALVAELDALAAESAARQLAELDRLGRTALVQVPVHRATLSSRKYRELYLKICRGLFSRYRNKLVFDIFGIEDGTPSNRVTEHMQWLRPYARAIAATVDLDFSTVNSFSGAQVTSVGVTLEGAEDESVDLRLNRFVPRLKAVDARCHVHGVRTQSQLNLCASLMVGAISGDAIGEGGGRRLELVRDDRAMGG